MAVSQRRKHLEQERERRGPIEDGLKIARRRDLRGGFRFLADTGAMIVHDLAREKDTCELEGLFERGEARAHTRPLTDAQSGGFETCDRCIGESPEKTFDGTNTVLFVMHLPRNRSMTQLDGVLERENFTGRVLSGIKNNPADESRLPDVMREHNAKTLFVQGRRARASDMNPEKWGEPDIMSSLNPDLAATRPPANDVRADIFIPSSVADRNADPKEYARGLVEDLLDVETIRGEIAGHGRRYGYRDLASWAHAVDSVDNWVAHRPHPKCTSCFGGGGSGSWSFIGDVSTTRTYTHDGQVITDTTVSGGVEFYW